MLRLKEDNLRSGKPIGLPYKGSKKKISKKIVKIISENFGVDKPIYDVFGGGGAITAECILNGLKVHYNDLDKRITDCFVKVLTSDRNYLKSLIVCRDDFLEILSKNQKTIDDELKLLINSFGNNRKGYLFSKENSDIKFLAAKEIIEKEDVFGGYAQTETFLKRKGVMTNNAIIQHTKSGYRSTGKVTG